MIDKEQARRLGEVVAKINRLRDEVDMMSDQNDTDLTVEAALTDCSDQLSLAAASIKDMLKPA